MSEDGTPIRETTGLVTFDNDGSTDWWLDATPFDSSEYANFTTYSADLGGGVINTGRVYTGGIGLAGASFDLFNIALHEIGHALGMSSNNTAFQAEARDSGDNDIDVNIAGFVGTVLDIRSDAAHYSSTGDTAQASLGRLVTKGSRYMLSCVDILGNAQISGFTNFNCDPDNPIPESSELTLSGLELIGPGDSDNTTTTPEPSTLALFGLGLIGLGVARRRRAA